MTACPDLLALDDDGLLRYIFGEETLNRDRQSHLEQCSICQQRLLDYQNTHSLLLTQLYRVECPDATQLSLYCGNMLSRKENSAINRHLSTCLLCTDEVDTIRHELARFPSPSKPEVFSLWQFPQKSRHLTARLVLQPQSSLRQKSAPSEWPRYYQSPAINLSLHLSYTSEQQLMLVGIFMCDEEEQNQAYSGTVVDLYLPEEQQSSGEMLPVEKQPIHPFLSTTVDELGHFSFAPLQAGHYAILLHLPDAELLVEQIELE